MYFKRIARLNVLAFHWLESAQSQVGNTGLSTSTDVLHSCTLTEYIVVFCSFQTISCTLRKMNPMKSSAWMKSLCPSGYFHRVCIM